MERVCDLLDECRGREVQYNIIIVSEGATMTFDRRKFYKDNRADDFGHRMLGVLPPILQRKSRGKPDVKKFKN